MGKRISDETKKSICATYIEKPITLKELKKKFNLCQPTISKILDEAGLNRYKKSRLFNPDMDEDYFHIINTQNKAYFLGLIISDGNIFSTADGKRQQSVSITLAKEDKYLLEKFKTELNLETSVNNDGRGAYTIAARSDILANDLKNLGVCERKSFKTTLPSIDDELMRHLIRGILDGDGSVQSKQTSVRNRFKHSVGFCGTKELMSQIRDHLVSQLNVTNVSVYSYKNKPLSMVTWAGINDIHILYDYLYKDAEVFMKRKRDKFLDILEHYKLI